MAKDDYPKYTITFKNDNEAYEFAKGLYCFRYSSSSYLNDNFKELFMNVMAQINTQYDVRQENKRFKESGRKIKPVKRKLEQEEWVL